MEPRDACGHRKVLEPLENVGQDPRRLEIDNKHSLLGKLSFLLKPQHRGQAIPVKWLKLGNFQLTNTTVGQFRRLNDSCGC